VSKIQKIMKKNLTTLLLLICAVPMFGQNVILLNLGFGELYIFNTTRSRIVAIPGNYFYTDSEKRNILEKQYLTDFYVASKVDDLKDESYLRFNHFADQMEFDKDGMIHYLKKEEGRTVEFTELDLLYRVYELYGDLDYLLVKVEGKNSLLVKQTSKYIPAMRTRTSYGFQINPKYRRNKDQYFLSTDNGEMIELHWRESKFYDALGEKAVAVKEFIEEKNLNHRKVEDLVQVVEHLNTL
jgi:hypothetical protein